MPAARKEFEVVGRVVFVEEVDAEEEEAGGVLVAPHDIFSSVA
jgi:hypothetical protein